jgi:hypothetical protein
MDTSALVKIGLISGAGFLAYQMFFSDGNAKAGQAADKAADTADKATEAATTKQNEADAAKAAGDLARARELEAEVARLKAAAAEADKIAAAMAECTGKGGRWANNACQVAAGQQSATLRDQLAKAAGRTSGYNVHEWNWFLTNKVNPNAKTTDLSEVGLDPGNPTDLDTYLQGRREAGLSGFSLGRYRYAGYGTPVMNQWNSGPGNWKNWSGEWGFHS